MPGAVLLQLVREFATVSSVRMKEGAVEAVVDNFELAENLIGNKDGVFNRGGSGIVQFFGPITARWVLYNPKATPEDATYVGVGGRAELEFSRFVSFDRMGGELTGDINVKDCPNADGGADGETEGGGSGGAPTGESLQATPIK